MASEDSNQFARGLVVSVEPTVPRPAGRLGVFFWAIFVIALGEPQVLWDPFPKELLAGEKGRLGGFFVIASIPFFLSPLWAYLSDRVSLMATRREGYLILAGVLSAGGWAAAPFVPQGYGSWLAVSLVLGLGARSASTAAHGALVEIGQRTGNTGLLAAALVGLGLVAGLLSWPVSDVLLQHSLGWTATWGAALAMSLVLIVGMLSNEDHETSDTDPMPGSLSEIPLRDYLRSSMLWSALAIVGLAGLGTSPNLILKVKQVSAFPDDTWSTLERVTLAASLVSALAYAVLSRRMKARRLASLSLLAGTLGTLSLYAMDQDPSSLVLGLVLTARALGNGFVAVAIIDVAFRGAPRGREAFGYVLITGGAKVVVFPFAAFMLRSSLPTLIAMSAALNTLAALAVARSPQALFASPTRPTVRDPSR